MLNGALVQNDVSYDEAYDLYRVLYDKSTVVEKVKLKSWLYYMQCRDKGGRKGVTYSDFVTLVDTMKFVELVRTYCIDVTDIGTIDEVVDSLKTAIPDRENVLM